MDDYSDKIKDIKMNLNSLKNDFNELSKVNFVKIFSNFLCVLL